MSKINAAKTIAVCREADRQEKRVALSPDTARKLISAGFAIRIEKQAGLASAYTDDMYKEAGVTIAATAATTAKGADILLCVGRPDDKTLANLKKNAIVIGTLGGFDFAKTTSAYKGQALSAMTLDFVPRITRAQSMDVLSSQANLAGYKAVLEATSHFPRAMPMMMTAAGTVPPAKVFVMGAGVAGLQAIATARRLGAIVSATDVRMAAKEQVESLGASFVMVEDEETKKAETSGGYAKEMSKTYQKKQAKLIADTIAKQDIVITTALIPGRPAPELVNEAMVKAMPEGGVIVDLAAPNGGNCALTKPGQVVQAHGVTIIGHTDMASRMAASASALYARNIMTFLLHLCDGKAETLAVNLDDEIVQAVTLLHDGKAVHTSLKPSKKATPAKKPAAKKAVATKNPAKKATVKQAATTKAVAKKPAATKAKTTQKKTGTKTKAATKKTAAKKNSTKTITTKPAQKKTARKGAKK